MRRDQGKAERRARIVEAGRQLLFVEKEPGLSMVKLAERAGVSAGTPYNLFGSKQAILERILVNEFAEFHARIDASDAPPLEKIFQIVEVSAQINRDNPYYTRQIGRAAQGTEAGIQQMLNREHLWLPLVETLDALKRGGGLVREADTAALATTMRHLYSAAITTLSQGPGKVDQFEAVCGYGFALCLLALATDEARLRLRERLLTYQAYAAQFPE